MQLMSQNCKDKWRRYLSS